MQNYNVTMIRTHMDDIPEFTLKAGFDIRKYRSNECHVWTSIQQKSETFFAIDDQLFHREFGNDYTAMEDRCFFLTSSKGDEIGTITAWWNESWREQNWGRVHWVAIVPDYQGKGLSKPMMSVAMKRLKKSHDRCFLTTSSRRLVAIKIYLEFGFCPDLESKNSVQAWSQLARFLDHPTLQEYGF